MTTQTSGSKLQGSDLVTMRKLNARELDLVAGGETYTYRDGGRVVTEHYKDNVFVGASYANDNGSGSWWNTSGQNGTWSGSTGYWSIGGSLGLGFGLWGTGTGDWGIAWNVGIGGYVISGTADSPAAAIQTVTEDKIVIGVDINNVPTQVEINPKTGEVTYGEIGISLGLFATDPEGPPRMDPYLREQ